MAAINPPGYLNNLTSHTALTDRHSGGAGLLVPDAAGSLRSAGGVRVPSDLVVTYSSGTDISLSAGLAYVPQGQNPIGGTYVVANDGAIPFTLGARHATLTRYDLIVARVQDAFYSGSTNTADFIPIAGSAATIPADPALPAGASYLPLYRVIVPPTGSLLLVRLARPAQVYGAVASYPTEAAIAALTASQVWPGFKAYAEDTGAEAVWDGTRMVFYDTKWQSYTPTVTVGVTNITLGNALVACRYFRKGREITINGYLQLGSTTNYNSGSGIFYIDYPVGLRPYFPLPAASSPHSLGGPCRISGPAFGSGWCLNQYVAAAASRRMWFVNFSDIVTQGGTGGGLNLSAPGHWINWQNTYETQFEA
jgi:hypothetical protein